MDRTVDFFIVGAQKGGTTGLDHYLRRHDQIQMARMKEVHHFDDETRVDWSDPNHDRLHSAFDWGKPVIVRGETSSIYAYWPPESLSFRDAIFPMGRERVSAAHRIFFYVERGFCASQLERLFSFFPRPHIHVVKSEHLWCDPGDVLSTLEVFLGVEPRLADVANAGYVVPVDATGAGEVADQDRQYLNELFHDDIGRTAELTGLDLSRWLSADYREPMQPLASAAHRMTFPAHPIF